MNLETKTESAAPENKSGAETSTSAAKTDADNPIPISRASVSHHYFNFSSILHRSYLTNTYTHILEENMKSIYYGLMNIFTCRLYVIYRRHTFAVFYYVILSSPNFSLGIDIEISMCTT